MKATFRTLLASFSQVSMTAIWFICVSLAMFITSAWVIVYWLSYNPGYAGFAVSIFAVIHSLVSAQIVIRMIREHEQKVDLQALQNEIVTMGEKLDELKQVMS